MSLQKQSAIFTSKLQFVPKIYPLMRVDLKLWSWRLSVTWLCWIKNSSRQGLSVTILECLSSRFAATKIAMLKMYFVMVVKNFSLSALMQTAVVSRRDQNQTVKWQRLWQKPKIWVQTNKYPTTLQQGIHFDTLTWLANFSCSTF